MHQVIKKDATDSIVTYESVEGDFVTGMRFRHLRIRNWNELPKHSELNVEELYVKASSFRVNNLDIQIRNARLKMPSSEDIVVNGSLSHGVVDIILQADSVDVDEFANSFLKRQSAKYWPTLVKQLNATIKGNYKTPTIAGSLTITGLRELSEKSELKIQEFRVKVNSLNINGLDVRINNARLRLPVSDPIVINGSFRSGVLDATVFTSSLDVSEIAGYMPKNFHTRYLQGLVKQLDVQILGHYEKPVLTGSLMVVELDNRQVTLKEMPVEFNLKFKGLLTNPQMSGDIAATEGKVSAKRTYLKLNPSELYFSDEPKNPRLDIKGETKIGKTVIYVAVGGTLKEPTINLSSDPYLPEQELFLMLATGKRWESLDESMSTGTVSPQLTKDLLEYMFFGGTGNKMAERFGITDISFSFDANRKGIGATKKLSETVDVKYEVQNETDPDAPEGTKGTVTQKVGSEIQVTNKVTLDINKEFKNTDSTELDPQDVGASEILMKYKVNF